MRIMKSPQIRLDEKRFDFSFWVDSITATFDGVSDTFDFSGLPDGGIDSSMIDTILSINPVISAEKFGGVLSVELVNFISEDASEQEKFPEWMEV